MSQDDSTTPAPVQTPAGEEPKGAVTVTDDLPALSPEALAAFESLVPLLVEPETLIQGLRFLQQRIPGFVQLSEAETRSMIKAAHVDPEILEIGIHVAGAWPEAKTVVGMTGEELQREADLIRRWNGAERELQSLLEGVSGALLRRKHTLGQAILDIYFLLTRAMKRKHGPTHLRPHFEELRRAFARQRKGRRKK